MQGIISPNRWEEGRQECQLSFCLGMPGCFRAVPCWYFSLPGYQVPGTKRTVRCEGITPVALAEDMTLKCSWHPAPRHFTSHWNHCWQRHGTKPTQWKGTLFWLLKTERIIHRFSVVWPWGNDSSTKYHTSKFSDELRHGRKYNLFIQFSALSPANQLK